MKDTIYQIVYQIVLTMMIVAVGVSSMVIVDAIKYIMIHEQYRQLQYTDSITIPESTQTLGIHP